VRRYIGFGKRKSDSEATIKDIKTGGKIFLDLENIFIVWELLMSDNLATALNGQ